ncbi:L,D-transpeptidase [Leifsonia sp. LS1]|uniref:L,D-transpeptidase n=1 Tax=Leifsonia sp. LS1 TaxID=2828483 RepID=UPI001CFCB9B5|nr:L,D-transpeptidase [Leifsonia sp. LS1]
MSTFPSTARVIRRTIRATLAVAAAATVLCMTACAQPEPAASTSPPAMPTPAPSTPASAPPVPALTRSDIAALPAAVYDAVIPGLQPAPAGPLTASTAHSVMFDTPLFAADRVTPVARIPATDFRGQRTVVVPIRTDGPWALVLTPARQVLPSQVAPGDAAAPAQTVAWMPAANLAGSTALGKTVRISVVAQKLSILDTSGGVTASWSVGVGTEETPTPTGVTGYLQARYTDPEQGQSVHPIQLTTLHATAADEPFGGADGGLIGIHFFEQNTGAVSHGCVRVSAEAIDALNALPLGTLVTVEN